MGCDGCELWDASVKNCYAGVLHGTRGKSNSGFAPTFEQVTAFPGRMSKASRWSDLRGTTRPDKPWLDGYPRLIFVSDMGDSLSRNVSFDYLRDEVLEAALTTHGQRHRWLWLTKRPHRMAEFSTWLSDLGIAWPSNVWVGTSITTSSSTNRVNSLLRVGDSDTTRFLSIEPQIAQIDLGPWFPKLDWIIQGGESGRAPRTFDVAWARQLRDSCRQYKIPYFLKQLGANPVESGARLRLRDSHGGDWDEWATDLRIRELPPASKEPALIHVAERINIEGYIEAIRNEHGRDDKSAVAAKQEASSSGAVADEKPAWPALLLPEALGRPLFPVHVLPEHLREYVLDVARVFQVAVDMPAVFALSAIGAAAAKRVRIANSSDGQDFHSVNIWVVVVLASGEGKTPTMRSMLREFSTWQDTLRERAAADAVSRRVRRDIAQRRYSVLVQRCARSTNPVEIAKLEEQTITLRAELAALQDRPAPRVMVEDMTMEALLDLLSENDGALLGASDEGSRFFANAGRSAAGGIANIEGLLKAHSAATVHVDRVSRGSVVIHEPALSLMLATQQRTLGKVLASASFDGRGLWERFLVVSPQSTVGSRAGSSPSADPWTQAFFHAKVRALLGLPRYTRHFTNAGVPEIRLGRAWSVLGAFLESIDRRMAPGGDLSREPIAGWAQKLRTNVIRLSAILWVADNTVAADWSAIDIDPVYVERAIELAHYFISHAQLLFGRERSALEGDVELVLDWLKGRTTFTVRDLQRAMSVTFPRRELIDPVLAVLLKRNAVRTLPSSGGVGRPSEQFAVHPDLANQVRL